MGTAIFEDTQETHGPILCAVWIGRPTQACTVHGQAERLGSGGGKPGWVHVWCAPYSKYPLCSGYHVDPLLKKEVFAMENQSFPKIP